MTKLDVFCDADYAGNSDYSSTTGCVVMMAGGPVHWFAQKQKIICKFPSEAELGAICSAASTVAWLKHILRDLRLNVEAHVWSDNESAIKLVKNERAQHRTRHIGSEQLILEAKLKKRN